MIRIPSSFDFVSCAISIIIFGLMLWRPRIFRPSDKYASNDIQANLLVALMIYVVMVVPAAASVTAGTKRSAAAEAVSPETGEKNAGMNGEFGEYLPSKASDATFESTYSRSGSLESMGNNAVLEEHPVAAVRLDQGSRPQELSKNGVERVAQEAMATTRRRLASYTYVDSEAALANAITDYAYILLTANITLNASVQHLPTGSIAGSVFTVDGVTDLTIDGQGQYTIGFDSSNKDNGRIFHIKNGAKVELVDLMLSNSYFYSESASGAYGGAIHLVGSELVMSRCTISRSKVYWFDGSGMGVVGAYGGAIYTSSSTLTMSSCSIMHNSAESGLVAGYLGNGGALFFYNSVIQMSSCFIMGNAASGEGGAIYLSTDGDFACNGCYFYDNEISSASKDNADDSSGGDSRGYPTPLPTQLPSTSPASDDIYIQASFSGSIVIEDCKNGQGSLGNLRTNAGLYGNYDCGLTVAPTALPTSLPTVLPSLVPTTQPTLEPTGEPTGEPTSEPTSVPSLVPTTQPTIEPTSLPSLVPTTQPTGEPTLEPTSVPSLEPTALPTGTPSLTPSSSPTLAPSAPPTNTPSLVPTSLPTLKPTRLPTLSPTALPTVVPTPIAIFHELKDDSYECSGDDPIIVRWQTKNKVVKSCVDMEVVLLNTINTNQTEYLLSAAVANNEGNNAYTWQPLLDDSYSCDNMTYFIRLSCNDDSAAPYETTVFQLTSSKNCPAGEYLGAAGCVLCPAGSYSEYAARTCIICGSGQYAAESGSPKCAECPMGRYLSDAGNLPDFHDSENDCLLCAEGEHAPDRGAVSCDKCIYPTTTTSLGAENCSGCAKDYYWDPLSGLGGCIKCRKGVNCINNNHTLYTLPIKRGWYRASSTATTVYKCANDDCGGGSVAVGDDTCDNNAKGPLCALCKPNKFRASNEKCKDCLLTHIFASVAVILGIICCIILLAVVWYCGQGSMWCKGAYNYLKASILEHKARFFWMGITLRIIYFNCQIIAKCTELQDIEWPFPFKGYVGILSGVSLNLDQIVPSLRCFPSWNGHTSLLIWTLLPFIVYTGAVLVAIAKQHEGTAPLRTRLETTTKDALKVLSLVHTLIAIQIFQIFDCDEFDVGEKRGPSIDDSKNPHIIRYLSSDYSIKCDTKVHSSYQYYAGFMIVVYCAVIPAIMTRLTWIQRQNMELSDGVYKSSCWWFDTFDLFYRLSMTGLLLAFFEKSEIRMVASMLISAACMCFVHQLRPFLNESHNAVLGTGQTVVLITVACGYVVTFGQVKGWRIGTLLLVINIMVVIASILLQQFEGLHILIDAILAQRSFDRDSLSRLGRGSSLEAICDAMLKSACVCINNLSHGDDTTADYYFEYLIKNLLPLKIVDGRFLWDSKIPSGVNWVPLLQLHLDTLVNDFLSGKDKLPRDIEECVAIAREVFGSLISEADERAVFQNLMEAQTAQGLIRSDDVEFNFELVRGRARSQFAGENLIIEKVHGVGRERAEEIILAPFYSETDVEKGPSRSDMAFGAPSVSSLNDDIEEKQREEQADKKLRRGDVGDRDIVVETGGSTVLDDSKIIDESQQQHCDDVDTMSPRHSSISFQNEREDLYHEIRPSQYSLDPLKSGESERYSNNVATQDNATSSRHSSIWFQNEREDLYHETRPSQHTQNPLRRREAERSSNNVATQGNFESEIFEVEVKSDGSQLTAELVEAGIRKLCRNLSKKTPTTFFAVLQIISSAHHKIIMNQQEAAAASMLAEGEWGRRLKELENPGVADEMRQKIALTMSAFIRKACFTENFKDTLDEEILPAVMCAISKEVRPLFQEALLGAVPGAALHNVDGESHVEAVELKVGPTKRASRVAVKITEYRKEKNQWPYAQFVTDVMRASFICETAEDFVRAYEGIEASDHFKVVRMKNKIGKCQGPFNLHVNVLFSPQECEDPILCEIQFYPKDVYQLQHRQHLAYELRRATSVKDLI